MSHANAQIGLCPDAVITELFISGNVEFDQARETRVKEWLVNCPSGENIYPANVLGNNSGVGGWDQGSSWGEGSLSGPVDAHGSPLLVQHVRVRQLTPASLRVTALYSTDFDLWAVKSRIDVVTDSTPLLIDLNVRDNPDCDDALAPVGFPIYDYSGSADGIIAKTYCVLKNQFPFDLNAGNMINIDFDRGRDIPIAHLNIAFSGLFPLSAADIKELSGLVNTLNWDWFIDVDDEQQWRFAGLSGEEVRILDDNNSVWHLDLRFSRDWDRHMLVAPVNADGGNTQFPFRDQNGKRVFRAVRAFDVFHWGGPLGALDIP